jgi:DNA-binding winged helix-turn-helix (wHTH) protein/tetratricopeptide (TPR) repeat protein
MPHSNNLCYEFGPYRFDISQRVLTRSGEVVSLTPKATEILVLLVANAGQLVEREELLKEVWPSTFVEEANLTQNIFTLRRALGDDRVGHKYIETVARRGYRFVATVRTVVRPNNKRSNTFGIGSKRQGANVGTSQPVLAILPFLNTTGNDAVEYLADALTDNIINNLSRVSKLRVMSRSGVFRYKTKEVDPMTVGRELGVDAILLGKLTTRRSGIGISVELVDVTNGWQLWGATFDCEVKDLLEIENSITRQLLVTLRLKLTGDEEKRMAARYTENADAYQFYLEGRYHWSRYTREGIEKAIRHFRRAIDLDPNYALAYAGIVDCYLRLATNYLPPEDDAAKPAAEAVGPQSGPSTLDASDSKVKLRFTWDWKGAERELRRANELKSDYPAAHQWYAAYNWARQLFQQSQSLKQPQASKLVTNDVTGRSRLISQIPSLDLTPGEQVQISCAIAREQIAVGNYDAGNLILQPWCSEGEWPKLQGLSPYAAADLLFTLGTLIGSLYSTKRMTKVQKHAEAFLSGSVALFEHLGTKSRSVEARVELARCYYREGFFDIARETLSRALSALPEEQWEIRSVCLVLWGVVERDAGRLMDSLSKLREAASLEVAGQLVTGRCYHELATTLKELAISEHREAYFDQAKLHFQRALYECEAIGNHRHTAAVENNLGYLLLCRGFHDESEMHLLRSRRLFGFFADSVRGAQVDETLAHLYVATEQYARAQEVIEQAVETLELTDGEALLAEALTTKGVVACRLKRYIEAKKSFEAAYRVAERCGDHEGAGRALLILLEEMGDSLENDEKLQTAEKLKSLLSTTQQSSLLARVEALNQKPPRSF